MQPRSRADADKELDAELRDSFPASDPPSILRRSRKDKLPARTVGSRTDQTMRPEKAKPPINRPH